MIYVAPLRGVRILTYHPDSSWQSADMSSVLSFKSLVTKQRISVHLPLVSNNCSKNISDSLSPSYEQTALAEERVAASRQGLSLRVCILLSAHEFINQRRPSFNRLNSGQYNILEYVDDTLNALTAGLLSVFLASVFFARR